MSTNHTAPLNPNPRAAPPPQPVLFSEIHTSRTTRLVRVPDLQGFRDAAVALACGGAPLDARDRLVIVPTRAAAAHFVRSIENRLPAAADAVLLPDLVTRDELHARLAERLPPHPGVLTAAEREVLLGAACRAAADEGAEPPFHLRPGLIAEILRLYDTLGRNRKSVDAFERLALGTLEPGATYDRGAERLLRQTRFLVSAFRRFERRCEESAGIDEHTLTRVLVETPAARPWRHVVVTVGDRACASHGLFPADWDLLARLPGLERLDVVATDTMIAGAFHERIHQALPGIEEVGFQANGERPPPVLLIPPGGPLAQASRDREEEIAGFARWVRRAVRDADAPALDRVALVVHRPLPYVYTRARGAAVGADSVSDVRGPAVGGGALRGGAGSCVLLRQRQLRARAGRGVVAIAALPIRARSARVDPSVRDREGRQPADAARCERA